MADETPFNVVTLGGREYRIVEQGIGRIRRKLGTLMGVGGGEGLTGEIDEQVHEALRTFIPDIAPVYNLLGYASEEEWKAGGEPDGAIDEVTIPQLLDAWEVIKVVNGGDRLVRLGKAIGLDPDLIRMTLNREVAEMSLRRSSSSRSASGESESESSTPTPETSPEPSAPPSLSPAS